MHQTRQRRFCRWVFLVGCIAPTLAVLAWACYERWPATMAHRLHRVEQTLGMRVTVANLSTPTPGEYRANRLELRNVETNQIVLKARSATYQVIDGTLVVQLHGARLSPQELTLIAETLQRTLEVDWPRSVRILMPEIEWLNEDSPPSALRLDEKTLVATLETTRGGNEPTSRQWIVELGNEGPRVEVHRNRQIDPPATRIVVDTAGARLPAAWIASLGALVVDGGPEATFAGTATITTSPSGTSGHLTGTLDGVSLSQALQLPIESMASIHNLEIEWNAGQITQAAGLVEATGGTLAGSFGQSLQHLYQMPQPGAQVAEQDTLAFGRLAVSFALDRQSLSLWGAVPTDNHQVLVSMLDEKSQVLFGQPTFRVPIASVAGVLTNLGDKRAGEVAAALPRSVRR